MHSSLPLSIFRFYTIFLIFLKHFNCVDCFVPDKMSTGWLTTGVKILLENNSDCLHVGICQISCEILILYEFQASLRQTNVFTFKYSRLFAFFWNINIYPGKKTNDWTWQGRVVSLLFSLALLDAGKSQKVRRTD